VTAPVWANGCLQQIAANRFSIPQDVIAILLQGFVRPSLHHLSSSTTLDALDQVSAREQNTPHIERHRARNGQYAHTADHKDAGTGALDFGDAGRSRGECPTPGIRWRSRNADALTELECIALPNDRLDLEHRQRPAPKASILAPQRLPLQLESRARRPQQRLEWQTQSRTHRAADSARSAGNHWADSTRPSRDSRTLKS
jgi:hypothetical protein